MHDNTYLRYGLNALSRAHKFDYFLDGHRGGAIVSGVYFCRENDVEADVPEIVARLIDNHWAHTDLCARFPNEAADPQLLDRIVACMAANMDDMRQAGHNVILPTLALKAFHELPEAITPARVDGVCRLVEAMTVMDVISEERVDLPDMSDSASVADFILNEFVACVTRFVGRGQGWSGHLLTYGRARLDLHELGYGDLAKQAAAGFELYIRRIRMGPQETDKPRPEHEPTHLFPPQAAYWRERVGDLTFGHQLKYPYGFYGLMKHVTDPEIEQRSLDIAFRIF